MDGVDSSVSAVLLKEQGYDVVGTTMELYNCGSCCNTETYMDAKRVCNQIGVPHFIFNFKEEFQKFVIDDFIDCYRNCLTPNPCIECNKHMKFGAMWEKAKEMDCFYIATGHYAKTEYSEEFGRWVLKKSNAGRKDQSYVLWNIPKELVEHVVFPLADFEDKEQIREIARENGLRVANKPDSEDICFIPDGNYKKFLENNSDIRPKAGKIVHVDGRVLGKHEGLYHYTIGQRKGLGISYSEPLFVVGFDRKRNEVIVGEEQYIYKKSCKVTDVNLLLVDSLDEPMRVNVKTRYSSKEVPAVISGLENGDVLVEFEEPVARVTPGQSAVFYLEDIVVGGGKIIAE